MSVADNARPHKSGGAAVQRVPVSEPTEHLEQRGGRCAQLFLPSLDPDHREPREHYHPQSGDGSIHDTQHHRPAGAGECDHWAVAAVQCAVWGVPPGHSRQQVRTGHSIHQCQVGESQILSIIHFEALNSMEN